MSAYLRIINCELYNISPYLDSQLLSLCCYSKVSLGSHQIRINNLSLTRNFENKCYSLIIYNGLSLFEDSSDFNAAIRCFCFRDQTDIYLNDQLVVNYVQYEEYEVGQATNKHPYRYDISLNGLDYIGADVEPIKLSSSLNTHLCKSLSLSLSDEDTNINKFYLTDGDHYTIIVTETDVICLLDGFIDETLVESFDIEQFLGKWYLIGSIQEDFNSREIMNLSLEDSCVAICYGKYDHHYKLLRALLGSIIIPNPLLSAKLEFNVNNIISERLVHKIDYGSYVVIGSKDRDYLLIMSRECQMEVSLFIELMDFVKGLGYAKYAIKNHHRMLK